MSLLIPFIVGIVVAVLSVAAVLFVPRSPNSDVIKVSLVMTLVCCYLMWSITYLAQANPLFPPVLSTETH